MARSWPTSSRKSPPRSLTTTAPSTPGAHKQHARPAPGSGGRSAGSPRARWSPRSWCSRPGRWPARTAPRCRCGAECRRRGDERRDSACSRSPSATAGYGGPRRCRRSGRGPAVEHRAVLDTRRPAGPPGRGRRTPDLWPRAGCPRSRCAAHGEGHPELGQRQHPWRRRTRPRSRRDGRRQPASLAGAPDAHRVALPAPSPNPVGQPAGGSSEVSRSRASSSIAFQARVGIGARPRSR